MNPARSELVEIVESQEDGEKYANSREEDASPTKEQSTHEQSLQSSQLLGHGSQSDQRMVPEGAQAQAQAQVQVQVQVQLQCWRAFQGRANRGRKFLAMVIQTFVRKLGNPKSPAHEGCLE